MKVNTLVRHKKIKSLGIGCIAKIVGKKVVVNWGEVDTNKHNPSELEKVDVSKCKTVSMQKFRNRIVEDNGTMNDVIIGNELKQYVGIGWVSRGVITEADLKKYPRVVE